MAQTRKPEVEARILQAALEAFAELGYSGATIADIARRAGLSTGNTYRYFASKDDLFYRVIDDDTAAALLRLVRKRVASLATTGDLTALDEEAQRDAEALLRFWVEHRLQTVILLAHAEGSKHEGVRAAFVDAMVRSTRKKLSAPLSSEGELVLLTIFDNTVRALVAILQSCTDERAIRSAFALFWSYQLGGLAGLTKKVQP